MNTVNTVLAIGCRYMAHIGESARCRWVPVVDDRASLRHMALATSDGLPVLRREPKPESPII